MSYFGFGHYRDMVDDGELQPGQTIIVKEGMLSTIYTVLEPTGYRKRRVYKLGRGELTLNARNHLKERSWDLTD